MICSALIYLILATFWLTVSLGKPNKLDHWYDFPFLPLAFLLTLMVSDD